MFQVYDDKNYPLREETGIIIGLAKDVHRELGHGFLEIVYKDAFEYEFSKNEIL